MKLRNLAVIFAAMFLTLGLFGNVAVGSEHKLRAAHYFKAGDAWQAGFELFAEKVKEFTNGAIEVKIFGGGVLGGEDDYFQNMMEGVLDFAVLAPGSAGGFSKQIRLLGIPFLWKDKAHWTKALDGDVGAIMRERVLEETDVIMLEYWGGSERNIFSRSKSIWGIEDLEGFKMRVMPDPAQVDSFKALGCKPVIVPYLETYSGLQAGVVDGMENEAWTGFSMRFYEPAPFYSRSAHDITTRPLCMSGKVYRKLSEAHQEAIKRAARVATVFVRDLEEEQNQKYITRMIEEFDVRVNQVKRGPMIEATRSVRKGNAEKLNLTDVLDKIEKMAQ